jgi:TPR repeat protein
VAAPTNAAVTPDPSPGVTGKGAAELALAQEFLIGANGKQPNKSMAVQWLWKAVRKENVEATVLLSDLYLRGDGVPKSCDQARLLLDAAAIKGRKDAAEQLRNLAAFGCE